METLFFVGVVLAGCYLAFRPRQTTRLALREPAMSYLPPNKEPYQPDYGEREYESAYDPIVKLYRHEYEAEQRKLKTIDNLLGSLTPADADAELFTFWERDYFNLKAHKKRPAE